MAEAKRGEAAVRRGEISRRPAMYLPPLCFDAIPEAAGAARSSGVWVLSAVTTRVLMIDRPALLKLLPLRLPARALNDMSACKWRGGRDVCACAITMEELLTSHGGACARLTKQTPAQFYIVHPPEAPAALRRVFGAALGLRPGQLGRNPLTGRPFSAKRQFDPKHGLYALGFDRLLAFVAEGGFGCCDAKDRELMDPRSWAARLLAWSKNGGNPSSSSPRAQLPGSPIACHAQQSSMCLNVDVGAAEGGEKTCFTGDDMGMVCGWDGTAEEAYCTADAGGVKVCARAEKGGKCATGELPPANAYTAEQQKAKAGMQAHQPSSND